MNKTNNGGPAFPLQSDELIVDSFAGGGGASTGIEAAFGRPVDIAINHDAQAIAMHRINHPATAHYCESVFSVDPEEITGNQPVGLAWFSPDCTHFSKAKGGAPRSPRVRGLAWVVIRWARRVKPRVIMLENVEEFQDWGPLLEDGRPCPERRGQTFALWRDQLRAAGYQVEMRELRACDYGAPTTRKRLFVIARRDGLPIAWPRPTHGPGRAHPYRTAAECIDWSIPCPSIFGRARPLAEATMRRIARGVMRYVVNAAEPFIVPIANWSADTVQPASEPLRTVTAGGAKPALVAAFLAKHFTGAVGSDLRDPMATVTTIDHHSAVHVTLEPSDEADGSIPEPDRRESDRCATRRDSLEASESERHAAASATSYGDKIEARLSRREDPRGWQSVDRGGPSACLDGSSRADPAGHGHQPPGRQQAQQPPEQPRGGNARREPSARLQHEATRAVEDYAEADPRADCAEGQGLAGSRPVFRSDCARAGSGADDSLPRRSHVAAVRALLIKFYGTDQDPRLEEPLHTITTRDRFGLVTVHGEQYAIADIGMRMLQPRELYRAQGFPESYVIDFEHGGKPLPKAAQVRMCGNSVSPPVAEALVRANFVHEAAWRREEAVA